MFFIHRSHGRWIQNNNKCTKKKKKKTNIHTQQSTVPTYCINVAIIIMQKNIYLFNVTLAEFYRHDCRISESSLVSLTTNMLHNLFCDTVIFSRNFHLRLAIVDSADKQLNISRHSFTIPWDLVSKIFLSALLTASPPDSYQSSAPGPRWGNSVLQTPWFPTPGNNPAGANDYTCIGDIIKRSAQLQ